MKYSQLCILSVYLSQLDRGQHSEWPLLHSPLGVHSEPCCTYNATICFQVLFLNLKPRWTTESGIGWSVDHEVPRQTLLVVNWVKGLSYSELNAQPEADKCTGAIPREVSKNCIFSTLIWKHAMLYQCAMKCSPSLIINLW